MRSTLLMLALLGAAVSASAQSPGFNPAPLDLNHDGRLSDQEITAVAMQMFRTIDRNHDGVINLTDFGGPSTDPRTTPLSAWVEPGLGPAAQDNRITRQEFAVWWTEMEKAYVSKEDQMKKIEQQAAADTKHRRGIRGDFTTVRAQVAGARGAREEVEFRRRDANQDGVITVEDYVLRLTRSPASNVPPLAKLVPAWLQPATLDNTITADEFQALYLRYVRSMVH